MGGTHDCYERETFFATAVALRGQDGKDGETGDKGESGASVKEMSIKDGRLYATLTDGSKIEGAVDIEPIPNKEGMPDNSNNISVEPNLSVVILNSGSALAISLKSPSDTSHTNEYMLSIRNYAKGATITFDKVILWANDNVPVLDDNDGGGILEISIRCIDFGDEGLRYLGTWAKYTV